jgi:3',5'-nucleoside bisphosphate phosphatase
MIDGRSGGRRVDLHTHTNFSDGTLEPAALVARAIQRGLVAIAITDHDVVEGIAPARAAAGTGLEVVPAVEISSTFEGDELHILGYYIDTEDPALLGRLSGFRDDRWQRALEMVERLGQLGAPVDAGRVQALAGPGVVGRPHVAGALVEAGHATSIEDAFRRYIGSQGAAFVSRPRFDSSEAVSLIHGAGGVSVLAHAGGTFDAARLRRLAAAGLRGIEIWHPHHGMAAVRRLRDLARELELIETGGSDYHGPGRGAELGDLPVPPAVLQDLKDAAGVAG